MRIKIWTRDGRVVYSDRRELEETVKAHLTRVFEQIGVSDRTQAALWAQRHRFTGPR